MKSFVFNFISGDPKKFKSGEELFNLIATCLVFNQKVMVILDESYEDGLLKELGENKNLKIFRPDQAQSLLDKSDFYLEC